MTWAEPSTVIGEALHRHCKAAESPKQFRLFRVASLLDCFASLAMTLEGHGIAIARRRSFHRHCEDAERSEADEAIQCCVAVRVATLPGLLRLARNDVPSASLAML